MNTSGLVGEKKSFSKAFDYSIKGLLIGIVITLPLTPKLGSLFIVLLGLVGLTNSIRLKGLISPPVMFYFLMSLYLVRVLWLVRASDIAYGLKSLETEAPLLIIPLLFATFYLTGEAKTLVLRTYVLMALSIIVFSFFNLLHSVSGSELNWVEYFRLYLTNRKQSSESSMLTWKFAHPTFLSIMIIYALQIMLFFRRAFMKTSVIIIFSVLSGIFILLAGTKLGLIIYLLTFIVYFIARIQNFTFSKNFFQLLFIPVIVLILMMLGLSKNVNLAEIDPVRPGYMIKAINAFKKEPLIGYGTGSTKEIVKDIEMEKVGYRVNHPHNQILTDLVQFGIIGTIPLLLFILSSFKWAIITQNWLLLMVVLTFSILMLTESPINSNKGIVPFVVILCLIGFDRIDSYHSGLSKTKNT
ncbi:MAG: O-antigen ligase family protein [Cyclobacteriaceae bacterium]